MISSSILKKTLLCAALALSAGTAYAADSPSVLRVVPQSDLKILDPIWTTSAITRDYGYMVYDTLFGVDEKGDPKPEMVDSFSKSEDGKDWSFKLRKDLKFSDGTPVTSTDVIASLKRWSQRDGLGQVMFAMLDKIEAKGADSFELTFKQPFGLVLEAFSKPSSVPPFIMPAKVAATSADTQITDNTGSGPFMLKKDEYRPGERVVFVKNPHYVPRDEAPSGTAGGKKVLVDRLEWVVLKDAQTQANALANGEVDLIMSVPAEQYAPLKANPAIVVSSDNAPSATVTLQLNHLIPPFNNPKIAKAALMAIAQQPLMRAGAVHKELYNTCLSIYPCGSKYASDESLWFTGKPQFDQAKALLKEAGYDGKPIALMYPTDLTTLNKYPPVMAALLKQAGFNVDLQSMDWPTLQMRRAKHDTLDQGGWSAFVTVWAGSENVNPMFFPALSGNGEKGWFGWATDSQLEDLKSQFLASTNEADQKRLAIEIQKRVFEIGLFAPVGEYKPTVAYRKDKVQGLVKAPVSVYWNLSK